MIRSTHFAIVALFTLLVGLSAAAPARAASLPVGPALALDETSRPAAESVRWVVRCGPYGCRRVWVGPPRYYSRPVYYRRCFTQRRMVWTPYGWRPRYVRVCR
ncbi:hypothetical protein [Rhabdaerophilum calidifontis]|uniref:hypothetical protein n=1 Tax=Rhabdaerophilum calidifontis TaxID=2604328 RepID=UPI00123982C6|nr:hypothetical protein [Rhabdaerophilum calidifontis]